MRWISWFSVKTIFSLWRSSPKPIPPAGVLRNSKSCSRIKLNFVSGSHWIIWNWMMMYWTSRCLWRIRPIGWLGLHWNKRRHKGGLIPWITEQSRFFGDAWQTIYRSNKACGLIENENLAIIKKGSNFRSAPRIVRLLNDLRPDLPQTSAMHRFEPSWFFVSWMLLFP